MLLQAQSAEEFKANCRAAVASNGTRAVVVTVSPQSRVSLAHAAGLNPLDAAARLTGFFKAAGATRVFDSSSGRDFALLESCEEFVTRYKARRGATTHGVGVTTHGVMPPDSSWSDASLDPRDASFASSPGVDVGVPRMGVLRGEDARARDAASHQRREIAAGDHGYHRQTTRRGGVGFDPLGGVPRDGDAVLRQEPREASRDDFRDADGVPDVDCVLTTGEVAEMLAEAAGLGDADGDPAKVRAGAAALASVAPAPLDGWLACAGNNGDDAAAGWLWGSSVVGGGRRLGRVPRRRVSPRRARIVRRGSDGPAGV